MTRQTVISDSTPLIALARVGQLELVPAIFTRVLLPEAVFAEIVEVRDGAPGAAEVAQAGWIETIQADSLRVDTLLLLVDRGEAEAIAVAQSQPGSLLLTDDLKARREAKKINIEVQGTFAVLRRAKQLGLIPAVRPVTERLQSEGWRISEPFLSRFLNSIDE